MDITLMKSIFHNNILLLVQWKMYGCLVKNNDVIFVSLSESESHVLVL